MAWPQLGFKSWDCQHLGVDPLDEPSYGWIMPVAVRATSGHSYDVKNIIGSSYDDEAIGPQVFGYHATNPGKIHKVVANDLCRVLPGRHPCGQW